MSDIEKALQALIEALERNEAVEKVTVTITLKRPKTGKAGKPEK